MRGYTLIELLVTISIVVLVTGASLSAYLTFNENRQLDVDARNFNVALNKIRSKALFLEYPEGCTGLQNFEALSAVNAKGKKTVLRFFANCNNGIIGDTSEEILNSSYFITDFDLQFLPQSGNLASMADATITLQGEVGNTKTKQIIINQFMGTNNEIKSEQ